MYQGDGKEKAISLCKSYNKAYSALKKAKSAYINCKNEKEKAQLSDKLTNASNEFEEAKKAKDDFMSDNPVIRNDIQMLLYEMNKRKNSILFNE